MDVRALSSRSFLVVMSLVVSLLTACQRSDPTPVSAAVAVPSAPAPREAKLDIPCPKAPVQFYEAHDVGAEVKASLAKRADVAVGANVGAVVQELLRKYPNSDRLYGASLIASLNCEFARAATNLMDAQKLQAIQQATTDIVNLINKPEDELRAHAKHTAFELQRGLGRVESLAIEISPSRKTTLYISIRSAW